MTGFAFVEAKGLSKKYGGNYAVHSLDFEVRPNEIFGIIGPNGAGKTTTLKMISAIMAPTGGKCSVNGMDTADNAIEVKRIVGYLPEEDFLYGDMTPREHLRYTAELYGINPDEGNAMDILELVELGDIADKAIRDMSKGQRRRVAIANTLIHNPQLVILDELTSGLDPVLSRKMLDIVKDMKGKGKTIIFSTHIIDEATQLCDRIMFIDKGRIIAEGTARGIMSSTRTKSLKQAFFKAIGE